jgi:WhiB family redox-sensing transcriptional regulator
MMSAILAQEQTDVSGEIDPKGQGHRRRPGRVGLSQSMKGARYDSDSWRAAAACKDVDSEIFFPVGFTGAALEVAAKAKAICAGCSVREACLAFALKTNQQFGIWGGLDEEERREVRRAWRRERLHAPVGSEDDQGSV